MCEVKEIIGAHFKDHILSVCTVRLEVVENKGRTYDFISSHSNCQALYQKEEEGRKLSVSNLLFTVRSPSPSLLLNINSKISGGCSAWNPCELLDAWLLGLGRPGVSIEFLFLLIVRSRGNAHHYVFALRQFDLV